jgi:endonuclease YncB( thermonuclease family)
MIDVMSTSTIAVLFLLSLPVAAHADFPPHVVGVCDGDTLTILAAGNRQVKIRLYGIDAPETGQDFGNRAKQAASELALGRTVTVEPRDTDRYGRTLALIRRALRARIIVAASGWRCLGGRAGLGRWTRCPGWGRLMPARG